MLKIFSLLLLLVFSHSALSLEIPKAQLEYFKKFISSVQPLSFASNREYCGYFGLDNNDNFITTKPQQGGEDYCDLVDIDELPEDFYILFSYHTHGAFSIEADSELPSTMDLQGDIEDQIDGLIVTPGGRIWLNDYQDKIATLVCGPDCVMAAPDFNGALLDPVVDSYSLADLKKRDRLMQ